MQVKFVIRDIQTVDMASLYVCITKHKLLTAMLSSNIEFFICYSILQTRLIHDSHHGPIQKHI